MDFAAASRLSRDLVVFRAFAELIDSQNSIDFRDSTFTQIITYFRVLGEHLLFLKQSFMDLCIKVKRQ